MSKGAVATKVKIVPLDDRVVVKPEDAETVTSGGIVLPDSAQDKPTRGKVIAIGPGKLTKTGERVKPDVKVGDLVLYGKYSGSDVKINGEEHKIIQEGELLAKLD
ncbi:MAG: co-chaperone GroES [Planctomycetaceae bacterium]|nr:co-chaperone GroES [Planctomycetaceae bacterium]